MADVVAPHQDSSSPGPASEALGPSSSSSSSSKREKEADQQDQDQDQQDVLELALRFHNRPIALLFPAHATLSDLSALIATDLCIPPQNQKLLISPSPGPGQNLLRPPFKDPSLPLSTLLSLSTPTTTTTSTAKKQRTITLLGSTAAQVADLESTIQDIRARQEARRTALRAARKVAVSKHRDADRIKDEALYTFGRVAALPYLPNAAKSVRFLENLRDDAGVKAAMRKHRFSVGLLTEMDPAMHTTHQGRTLGLNRNAGEVIELRLRTDAGDGYRDYKTIRSTLAHELAHNVVGPHNAEFHRLWNQIEQEIERNDTQRGGRTLGAEEFYNPTDDGQVDFDDEEDGASWEGGAFVLGGGASAATGDAAAAAPSSRREAMARAAEERVRQQNNAGRGGKSDPTGKS